jgi:hypothetical protein
MVWRAAWNHHERNAAIIGTDVWERTRLSIERLLRASHWPNLPGRHHFGATS